jgi:hypothetical protein
LPKNLGEALQRIFTGQTQVLRLDAKQGEETAGAPMVMTTLPNDPMPLLMEKS